MEDPATLDQLRMQLNLADNDSAGRLLRIRADFAAAGEWVVFAGAGVSRNAGCPDWKGLAEAAVAQFGLALGPQGLEGADLPGLLQLCQQAAGAEPFWAFVSQLVCREVPDELHRLVVKLPYAVLATTNFDCLFDVARQQALDEAAPLQVYPGINSTRLHGGVHAYLHGRCMHHDGGPGHLAPDSCVMLTDQYDDAYGTDRLLPHAIESLLLNYPMLFVGTSFGDHDVQKLLTEVGRFEKDQVRRGRPYEPRPRFALEPGSPGDLDAQSTAHKFRVVPIRFLNPDDDYAALRDILRWLGTGVPPRTRYGDDE